MESTIEGNVSGSMTISDVFAIPGRGSVVTGTVNTGHFAVGYPVEIIHKNGQRTESKIDGIESIRKKMEIANCGEHVSLLLPGIDKSILQPGDIVSRKE